MPDPFFAPYPPLAEFVRPYAERLNLNSLHLHIHEVLIAFLGYHFIFLLSPTLSTLFFPRHYPQLKPRTRINWDVHVVSLVQSSFISGLALYQIIVDKQRSLPVAEGGEHRVYGYTPMGGATAAFALGYFVWDLWMSARYFDVFGIGFLMHALSAVVVYALGFRPFLNFYGPVFILFELSSPFLNFHWFFDKLNLTGSKLQLYNGLTLLAVFFSCRIVWGPIQSFFVYRDVWDAYWNPPLTREEGVVVPLWLAAIYMASNAVLNSLNFYWFGRMIEAVRKRFVKVPVVKGEAVLVEGKEPLLVNAEEVVVEGTKVKIPPVVIGVKKEL